MSNCIYILSCDKKMIIGNTANMLIYFTASFIIIALPNFFSLSKFFHYLISLSFIKIKMFNF